MAKTTSLIETLQNQLKAKFDANLANLAKLPFPVLLSIAKAQRLNVMKTVYITPPDNIRNEILTKERKNALIAWMRAVPVGCYTFDYNWSFSKEVPLYTKASEVYTLIHHDINERLLRATSGRNKDFIGLMINFSFVVEDALKNNKE